MTEDADVADGVFNALGDDTLAAVELLSVLEHLPAEDSRLDRKRDLARTGCLCAVADDSARDSERVYKGMCNLSQSSAFKEADSRYLNFSIDIESRFTAPGCTVGLSYLVNNSYRRLIIVDDSCLFAKKLKPESCMS